MLKMEQFEADSAPAVASQFSSFKNFFPTTRGNHLESVMITK
jgi:hypothetical protein